MLGRQRAKKVWRGRGCQVKCGARVVGRAKSRSAVWALPRHVASQIPRGIHQSREHPHFTRKQSNRRIMVYTRPMIYTSLIQNIRARCDRCYIQCILPKLSPLQRLHREDRIPVSFDHLCKGGVGVLEQHLKVCLEPGSSLGRRLEGRVLAAEAVVAGSRLVGSTVRLHYR
jgi:hypothetical protein